MKVHITKDGKKIKLCDMTDSHLAATISLFERLAKEGVTVRIGGGGSCAEDMWYDEYTLYGEEALERLGYANYVKERDRRITNRQNIRRKGEMKYKKRYLNDKLPLEGEG